MIKVKIAIIDGNLILITYKIEFIDTVQLKLYNTLLKSLFNTNRITSELHTHIHLCLT